MDTQLINDNLPGITEQCKLMDPTISCNSIRAKEKQGYSNNRHYCISFSILTCTGRTMIRSYMLFLTFFSIIICFS